MPIPHLLEQCEEKCYTYTVQHPSQATPSTLGLRRDLCGLEERVCNVHVAQTKLHRLRSTVQSAILHAIQRFSIMICSVADNATNSSNIVNLTFMGSPADWGWNENPFWTFREKKLL
jgi:hypothetical protein